MHNNGLPTVNGKVETSAYTVGSKTLAMFGSCGLIAMQRLMVWKYHLALV